MEPALSIEAAQKANIPHLIIKYRQQGQAIIKVATD